MLRSVPVSSHSFGRQSCNGAGNGAGIEGAKVVDAFADPDRVDGEAELLGRGDHDSAARAAIELGHDEAGDAGKVAEHLDLGQSVLAGGGVEDEQNVMRRFWVESAEDP